MKFLKLKAFVNSVLIHTTKIKTWLVYQYEKMQANMFGFFKKYAVENSRQLFFNHD